MYIHGREMVGRGSRDNGGVNEVLIREDEACAIQRDAREACEA